MNLDVVTGKIKSGALLLDEAKTLLSGIVTNNISDKTLKDFLLKEILEISQRSMHILILLNEFSLLENNSRALVSLYEIPVKSEGKN